MANTWAGIWRSGTDGYALWIGDWASFQSKWQEFSAQNLRLVSFETFLEGGVRKWAGVLSPGKRRPLPLGWRRLE
jgi:hypothetical protein